MGYNNKFICDYDQFVLVYVDGACYNNGKWNAAAGLGVVFNYNHPANYFGPVKGRPTNNAGEIQAATWAINEASEMGIPQLRIMTDSQFLINSATRWMYDWKRNGWYRKNGLPLANKIDFIYLDRAMKNNWDMDIEFEYVPAHSGDSLNDLADQLAKFGAWEYGNY